MDKSIVKFILQNIFIISTIEIFFLLFCNIGHEYT